MAPLAPIDETLEVAAENEPPVERPPAPLRFQPFFTVRSYALRLRLPLGWLLPRRRGVVLSGCLALLFLGWRGGLWPVPDGVEEVDPRILPTAARFAAATRGFRVDPAAEELDSSRSWDGSQKLRYVYRPEAPGQPSIWIVCWVEADVGAARQSLRRTYANTALDWGLFGQGQVGLEWLDEARPWSEESRVYRVEQGGRTLGYSIAARVGNKTLYAKLEGLDLQERQLRQIFQPTLLRLR